MKKPAKKSLPIMTIMAVAVLSLVVLYVTMKPNYTVVERFNGVQSLTLVPSTGPLLAEQIDSLIAIPELREAALRVKPKLSAYDSAFTSLPELAKGQRVDIILQLHQTIDDVSSNQRVPKIQEDIYRLLGRLRPDIIGTEGHSADRVTPATMLASVRDYARLHNISVNIAEIAPEILNEVKFDGGFRYTQEHPSIPLIGQEDADLNDLHDQQINWSFTHGSGENPIMVSLRMERSVIALHRMLTLMKREHKTHGVIIIGAAHAPELAALCKGLGIRGTMYSCVP